MTIERLIQRMKIKAEAVQAVVKQVIGTEIQQIMTIIFMSIGRIHPVFTQMGPLQLKSPAIQVCRVIV